MPYVITAATSKDREPFLQQWLQYLHEAHATGSPVLPNPYNMVQFRSLYDSYTVGSLRGFAIQALDPDSQVMGVVMAGESPGGFHLETNRGKLLEVWGVYVQPQARRQGLAHKMHDYGHKLAIELGFDGVVSQVRFDPAAQANSQSWGNVGEALLIYRKLGDL